MYKVFFNNNLLTLIPYQEFAVGRNEIISYEPDMDWSSIIDQLFNSKSSHVTIQSNSLVELWNSFAANFRLIEAAGGLVLNKDQEILCIHRLGKWDLPKGKIESGETQNIAAIREVQEECGIHGLNIVSEPTKTYHTYKLKNEIILKRTYWFQMIYKGDEELIPQTEEDITDVVWKKQSDLAEFKENTYPSILEVLDAHGVRNK